MDQVRVTVFKTLKYVFILNMFIIAAFAITMDRPVPYALGVLFGAMIGMLNFYELALTLMKSVNMSPSKANRYATTKYLLRFVITAIALFVAIRSPYLHILGAIAGVLSIKVVVYAMNLLNDKAFYKKIFVRKEE